MSGPLSGLLVLDFTTNIAGGYSTLILADQGADVIKIERPGKGDDSRLMSPVSGRTSAAFIAVNRGKRSAVIDMRTEDGKRAVRALAARADVIVENMRPGKLEALGLGFEDARELRSDIVYCSISGFGQTGPLSQLAAYDLIIQGRTGIMSITGAPDQEPVRVGPSIVDLSSGMWAAMSILAALWRRDEIGEAQRLDQSLFESGLGWMLLPIAQYTLSGEVPQRLGGQTSLAAPADVYPTQDGLVVLAVLNDAIWQRLCTLDELRAVADDPDFAVNATRVQNRGRLTEVLRAAFANYTTEALLAALQALGVPCDRVHGVLDILRDPQALAREMFVELTSPEAPAPITGVSIPMRNDRYGRGSDARARRAPALGEHTEEVLAEFAAGSHEAL